MGGLSLDEPAAKLVTEGPFGLSRNPGYLSFAMIYAGIACIRKSLWAALLLLGVLAVVQRRVIGSEEAYLDRAFGEEYRRYRGRVLRGPLLREGAHLAARRPARSRGRPPVSSP